jgi:protein-S-isoprenylcysteine O-methyltransferase Ste14
VEPSTRLTSLLALGLYVVWLVSTFAVRPLILRRRTGDAGFRRLSGRPGSAAWWGGILFVVAVLVGLAAPIAAITGLHPVPGLHHTAVSILAVVLALAGVAGTLISQSGMGTAWRVGVAAEERTALVTSGAFRYVRNPFFTAALITAAGLALLTPNLVAAAAVAILAAAIEIQVRQVEEPHLRHVHGEAYERYTAVTGRFLPRTRRLPTRPSRLRR